MGAASARQGVQVVRDKKSNCNISVYLHFIYIDGMYVSRPYEWLIK